MFFYSVLFISQKNIAPPSPFQTNVLSHVLGLPLLFIFHAIEDKNLEGGRIRVARGVNDFQISKAPGEAI